MKNGNQRRKYSNIKPFNEACSTAVHQATDKWVESMGATIRTGSEVDFIKMDPREKIAKNTRRLLRLGRQKEKERKAISSTAKPSERLTGKKGVG